MTSSRITPRTIYRAVLLAFALLVAGLVFKQLKTLIMGLLIVVIIALPLSAFATQLRRLGVPRAIGALLGLLIGIAALGGLIALIAPTFSHEINHFVNSLPTIVNDLRRRLAGLTGSSRPRSASRSRATSTTTRTTRPSCSARPRRLARPR